MSDLAVSEAGAEQRLPADEPDLFPLKPANRIAWRREIITDPAEIAAVRRRVEAGVARNARRGAWRRTLRRIRGGQR